MRRTKIRPIVEFMPLWPESSKQGAKYELFLTDNPETTKEPYYHKAREALKSCRGIYIFYDSRGSALYVGMAEKQNLWDEITLAFNRDRGWHQSARLVDHPPKGSFGKRRRIQERPLQLHELASYFSAYQITPISLISDIEALLIRGFANDLTNARIESISD